jgi:cytochrome P450
MVGTAVAARPGEAVRALVRLRRSPTRFFCDLAAEHPVTARVTIGPERAVVVNDPSLARELLTTRAKVTVKGRGLARARFLLGDGLLTSEGEVHRERRRRVQPAFARDRLDDYRAAMGAAARGLAARWSDGQCVDLGAEMSGLTLDIVGRTLFGVDVRSRSPEVADALDDVLRSFRLAMLPAGGLLLRSPLLPAGRRMRRARRRLDDVVADLVEAHRSDSRSPGGREHRATVLEILVGSTGGSDSLTDTEIRDEVMTLLLAGHETTAVAMTWTLAALSEHPDVLAELETEWASAGAEAPVTDLPLTTAVVAEALRLWPPAWIVGRRATSSFTLGPEHVAAGMLCLVSPYALHRDPRFWSDAGEFRPRRWLRGHDDPVFDPVAPGQPRGSYLPFGAGPRVCAGESFAWTELVTVLAAVGARWRVTLAGPMPVPGRPTVTLRPRGPVRAVVSARG